MAANEVLLLLGKINLAGAAAIVVVLILRKPLRLRFGARLAYSLWLLPLLASLAILAPARRIVIAPPAAPAVQAAPAPAPSVGPQRPVAVTAAPDRKLPDIGPALIAAWLGGALSAGLFMGLLQRRFLAEARRGGLGPAVVGAISPRIVVPLDFETRFSSEERGLVLAHETAHIARRDPQLNALAAALQCLFWFNPLIHLGAHLARIDQELACDEAVVTQFPEARRAYAHALVKAQLAIRPLPLGCYWPSGTEHPLLERLAMLKRDDFSRARRLAGATMLGLLCGAAGFAGWASQPTVTVVATPGAKARSIPASIPEMRPTGAYTPAFGSHPAGTPASLISGTTPEMTPTGVMRLAFATTGEPMPVEQAPQLPVPASPAPNTYPNTLQTALTDAEAKGQKVSVDGTLARVMYVNPQAILTIVDASGKSIEVASETPNMLIRQGVNRQTLTAGMPIHIDGFASDNGMIQARGAGMSSNGKPLAVNDVYGNPLSTAPAAPGAVIEQSPLTNSVIREGDATSRPR